MGAQRTTFSKLQRDRDKKAKAAAKRERRQERAAAASEEQATPVTESTEELSASDLLTLIERIHQSFEAGTMSYEEFEEQKAELLARLPVD